MGKGSMTKKTRQSKSQLKKKERVKRLIQSAKSGGRR
jgi:hypothetical protein